VSFIGSGNVATHLAMGLQAAGIELQEVYSPTKINAEIFADKFGCKPVPDIGLISDNADLYLIAVPDDEIRRASEMLPSLKGIVAHTSGITSLNSLSKKNKQAVFYPLQTFTKDRPVDLSKVPVCIESNNHDTVGSLSELAGKISKKVVIIDSDKRKFLHLAAVMVNNFTNHLYHIAQEMLEKENIDFELLLPLIAETAGKVQDISPVNAQTGPAKRKDSLTIDKHLELLANDPEYKELYRLLTAQIIKKYHE
jgi:predicted short-subunit dehydrogenase-like oxidoreductase (DUF2520 family)